MDIALFVVLAILLFAFYDDAKTDKQSRRYTAPRIKRDPTKHKRVTIKKTDRS